MPNPFTLLGPKARKAVYAIYAFAALIAICIDVGYNAAAVADPTWLKVTQDILAYLAAPVGVLAASNTPASPEEVVEAIEEKQAEANDPDLLIDPPERF